MEEEVTKTGEGGRKRLGGSDLGDSECLVRTIKLSWIGSRTRSMASSKSSLGLQSRLTESDVAPPLDRDPTAVSTASVSKHSFRWSLRALVFSILLQALFVLLHGPFMLPLHSLRLHHT